MRRPSGITAAGVLVAAAAVAGIGGVQSPATAGAAEGQDDPGGETRSVSPTGRLADQAMAAVAESPGELAASDRDSFDVTGVLVDADGTRHVRVTRTYAGLEVLGGDAVVHQKPAGAIESVSKTLGERLSVGTEPSVSARKATRAAVRRARGPASISDVATRGVPELVVDATRSAQPRLAWRVVSGGVQDDGTPSRLRTLVDARTGVVLGAAEQIQTADGEGNSLYGGTVPLTTTKSGSGFQLKDPSRGGSFTGDAENDTDLCLGSLCLHRAPHTLFTDADNEWGDGTTADRQSAAVDAQYGTDTTWDYYEDVHNRTGIAGDGKGSYNRVHYGQDYVNAFWDPSCFCMTYGDGDGANYGPLTSLDVAGHEMSHGVTSSTANLTYTGESGGLNEATSDIFGSMVEFYADNGEDSGDYLIGESFAKNGEPLRRMDDPASDGSSVGCWSSAVGGLDVHYSSGVGNHFYYLLAEGSGPKVINGVEHDSPTCDGSRVSGIGRDAAQSIWYRALTVYMTSSTDYHGARTATLDAARDLYGAGSAEYDAVGAAWAAVSVA